MTDDKECKCDGDCCCCSEEGGGYPMMMKCCEEHEMSKEHLGMEKKMLEEKLKWVNEKLEQN